jgi:hypothetical protein
MMITIKSMHLKSGHLLSVVNVASSGRGRWGRWYKVHVAETEGAFMGCRRKNFVKLHGSYEYDERSNKATKAAYEYAEAVFAEVLASAG